MRRRIAPITAITLTATGCLNLLLVLEIGRVVLSKDVTVSGRSSWDAGLSSIAEATGRKPLEAYAEILTHPVFFKSREPFVAPPPPPPTPPPQPPPQAPVAVVDPGLIVEGVMIKADLSRAFLLSRGGLNGSWVSEGQAFQGWQVKSIDRTGVKLEQSGRIIELQLYPQ
ncbi:hypothetical protein [Bradyrhizobium sp. SZCCHNR1039]|uniref:hypothetical protein n=1 Tax=Bradyrhizobium sp. SZCCHNR1039 TaxID=3057350 RepID=UPI0029166BA7|nr:hypothetical protein [Bradyrhizobium sp. SZCCHNR1039]